jgi:hypothetical protein
MKGMNPIIGAVLLLAFSLAIVTIFVEQSRNLNEQTNKLNFTKSYNAVTNAAPGYMNCYSTVNNTELMKFECNVTEINHTYVLDYTVKYRENKSNVVHIYS